MHEKLYLKTNGAHIFYGGEFFGCTQRQYITAETERSYMNLMMCFHDRQTSIIKKENIETVKDLSNLTGQSFRVFSFNENPNLKMVSRILAGSCCQGSWACFNIPDCQ